MKAGFNCIQYYFTQVQQVLTSQNNCKWLCLIKRLKKPPEDLCTLRSCVHHVLCSECFLQSQAGSFQDKPYWKKSILTASNTSPSVWGDRKSFGHWKNRFFFLFLWGTIYYSQHIINLKACFGTGRCGIALHQEKYLILKYFLLLLPYSKEKVYRADFLLPSPSLSRQLFHKSLQRNILSLSSPFYLHLFSLWTVFHTWITQTAS